MHGSFAPPTSLADALTGIGSALDEAQAVDLASATGAELADAVLASRRLRARLDALDAALVSRFTSRGEWALEARSARAWLVMRSHASAGEARARQQRATLCDRHPEMAARLAAGEVTEEHLHVLGQAYDRLPTLHAQFDCVAEIIAAQAAGGSPGDLRTYLARLALQLDPIALDEIGGRDLESRARLSVIEHADGWVSVRGLLPPELGSRLMAALRAAGTLVRDEDLGGAGRGPDTGADAASPMPASAPVPADDEVPALTPAEGGVRPSWQRHIEALPCLLDLVEAGLAANGGTGVTLRGQRPEVSVLVPLETFLAVRNEAGQVPCTVDGPGGRGDRPISGETARRLACDAAIRRVLVDPAGVPVAVGRATRSIPPGLATLVRVRDRRCRWPGCRHRIDENHHIVFWAHGGPTDPHNVLGLCWWHHHLIHSGSWQVTGDANDLVSFRDTRIGGRTLTSRPPRPPERRLL